ncbi:ribbon-helix-helix protein, CopG family [Nocardioides sp. WS12]|uniref:ribbon-helix-helix protein, CopG family n=1 Tax=Nocardioides sp. WS12 TaxID=2486272 RepID=UPI0015FDE669|nr:ribbon-helix-helix protein, CopG family [Nocardioides sp. WS12]
MKLSVSLTDGDVALIDAYARESGLASRSAVVQLAVRHLRQASLEDDYDAAWREWESSGEEAAWAAATSDGLDRAAR